MDKYRVVFVVLVYRNTQDLIDFLQHQNVPDSHVIVVNSYYDDASELEFKSICKLYGASFVMAPNNGYGAGNNRGCEYAIKHFDFDYLVISNADIMIKKFDADDLDPYNFAIIAPCIRNLRGKRQNPSSPFKPSWLNEQFHYFCYLHNFRHLIYLLHIASRLKKMFYYAIKGFKKQIFSAHGAFVIFPKQVLYMLLPLYNEKMFLFNEEEYLGRLAQMKKVPTLYLEQIKVLHKEDGSMKMAFIDYFEQMKQSYFVYYDKWVRNHSDYE